MSPGEDALVSWALGYDAYQRLASTPMDLERLLAPARRSFEERGVVPGWCGVDLLRGWAFLLVRADHQAGGDTLGEEWTAVLDALRRHEHTRGRDIPPSPAGSAAVDAVPRVFSTVERRHADPGFLHAKRARLREAHVAPVNDLVDAIRTEVAASRGVDTSGVSVPYVDPDSGGVLARVLFVLESPAGPAALGSGMLSPDNGVAAYLADHGITVLEVPHPSPRVVASTGGQNLVELREAMERAADLSGIRSRST